jgi:hypothetical protein
MQPNVLIENIEEMRRQEGIEDVELQEAIRGLAVGDFVWLTFLGSKEGISGETMLVRITSIRGSAFRGKLAKSPSSKNLTHLRVGSPVSFTAAHIHSLPRNRPAPGPRGTHSC